MRPIEVELLVQRAVEARRAGRPVEDDRIEFKSDWPQPTKARQLAGAANTLRGEPLIYVVGVNDAGKVVPISQREPNDWLATMVASFDSEAPRLVLHRMVQVGESSDDTVVALVFATDQFPYVMQVQGVSDRREVPVRVASGTASANRYQLLRLLQPTIDMPNLQVTESRAQATWRDTPRPTKGSEPVQIDRILSLDVNLRTRVFVEYMGSHVVTLPGRDIRARLRCGDTVAAMHVKLVERERPLHPALTANQADPIPRPWYGVVVHDNHVTATAPGEFTIIANTGYPKVSAPNSAMSDLFDKFATTGEIHLDLALRVIGVDRAVRLTVSLSQTASLVRKQDDSGPYGPTLEVTLGTWELPSTSNDPSSDAQP